MGISDWFKRKKDRGPTQIGVSKSGAPLLKYSGDEFNRPVIGFTEESTAELMAARERVYDTLFGECDNVLHELMPFVPHIDVYRYCPTPRRDFFTYITGGMSDVPMTVPRGDNADKRRCLASHGTGMLGRLG